jgi:hypothetical protein
MSFSCPRSTTELVFRATFLPSEAGQPAALPCTPKETFIHVIKQPQQAREYDNGYGHGCPSRVRASL